MHLRAGPATPALDLLASLVNKSLVIKEDVRSLACYRLHETMREFARLKLAEAGEEDAAELRCAEHFRSRAWHAALQARHRLPEWLAWADLEIDNIRAVLRRCLARADAARGIDLATALAWYWITRGTTEGMRWLGELLAPGDGAPQTRALGYFIRGFLAVLKADPATAQPALQAAIVAARQTQQPGLLAEALSLASIAENMAGDRASARRFLAEAESTAAAVDYYRATIAVLQARALDGMFERDPGAVSSAATEGTALAREASDLYALEMMLLNLGCARLIAGDLKESKPRLEEALRIARQIDDRVGQFCLLGVFGCHAARSGQARLAAQLLGAADTAGAEAGANVMPFLAPALRQAEESAITALGTERFDAEFSNGQRRGRDEALRLALGTPAAAGAAPGQGRPGLLGKREAEVARLIADGLTNKQIGTRLFISERTVDSHVRSILNKLGVSSRAQIAAWMAGPGRSGRLPGPFRRSLPAAAGTIPGRPAAPGCRPAARPRPGPGPPGPGRRPGPGGAGPAAAGTAAG